MQSYSKPLLHSRFFRPIILSLALAATTIAISVGIHFALPTLPVGAVVGSVIVAGLVPVVYHRWGGPSLLADAALWCTILMTIIGSIVAQTMICRISYGPDVAQTATTQLQCSVNAKRASTFGYIYFETILGAVIWGESAIHTGEPALARRVRNPQKPDDDLY